MISSCIAKAGFVYLVGAGPGAPGLCTWRGIQLIEQADVIIHDVLVSEQLLNLSKPQAIIVRASRLKPDPQKRQESINQQMLDYARSGSRVVRLKGGDPSVFGRCSEEIAFLRGHGIPFEIVPGVTAATAAAALSGFALTNRDSASAAALITGHQKDGAEPLDWSLLASFPGTLAFYMALDNLESITTNLIRNGLPQDTPAVVVQQTSTPCQRSIWGSLSNIATQVAKHRLQTPSVVIIGTTVGLNANAGWFEARPLMGQRVMVTRPKHQAAELSVLLEEQGAEVLQLPVLEIYPPQDSEPLDRSINELADYDWAVFTSRNGVVMFMNRLRELGKDTRCFGSTRLAAIGTATADCLAEYFLKADLVPARSNSESLAEELALRRPKRVLLARAEKARQALVDGLQSQGTHVTEVTTYSVRDAELDPKIVDRLVGGEVDWLTVMSPESFRALLDRLPKAAVAQLGSRIRIATISRLTTAAVAERGFAVAAEAKSASANALVDAVVDAVIDS